MGSKDPDNLFCLSAYLQDGTLMPQAHHDRVVVRIVHDAVAMRPVIVMRETTDVPIKAFTQTPTLIPRRHGYER